MSPFLAFGPRLNWQIPQKKNPETAYFNFQGFRTRETVGPKLPGEYRIIALGGSTTEDLWNEEGIHWPLILERTLRKNGYTQIKVLNGAMSAYSTAHSLIRLAFDIPEFEPGMVLVMHNVNDLTVNNYAALAGIPVDSHYNVKYGNKNKFYTGIIDEGDVIVSRVLNSLKARVKDLIPQKVPSQDHRVDRKRGLEIFSRNLRTISVVAGSHKFKLVFLTEPFCDSRKLFEQYRFVAARKLNIIDPLGEYEEFLSGMKEYNRAIIEVGAQTNVPVVDMASELGNDETDFADPVHYTSKGSRNFGEKLSPHIERLIRP